MKNLVSVIIPAYNHEKYIQETIQSIIDQTYSNIELIVIDDGSKDSTWEKIQEMKQICENRFSRVVFESQQNQGTCQTLNKLINYTQGEYIYIIASDDIAKPNAIETEYQFLSRHKNFALCVGDNEFIDEKSKRCYWDTNQNIVYDKLKAQYFTFGHFLQQAIPINFISKEFGRYDKLYQNNHVPNGYLIRKSIFARIGLYVPEAPLEDYWLMLQISKFAKMKFIDKILFSYRWHSTNTVKNREKMISITEKTQQYEKRLLMNSNFKNMLPIVKDVYINGYYYKKIGIPHILECLYYKKNNHTRKIIKLFGQKVFMFEKN